MTEIKRKLDLCKSIAKQKPFIFFAIAGGVQGLDLNIFPYENYRILEETLELLSALCLFSAAFKIKLHAHSIQANRLDD